MNSLYISRTESSPSSIQVLSVSQYWSAEVHPHRRCFCDNITGAERIHRDPLWESQQCEWLLMARNGRGVWAVYCCFDKLLMTCVVWGLRAQSECKNNRVLRKRVMMMMMMMIGRKKSVKKEMGPSVFLYRTRINAFKENRGEGEGAVIWRWRQWCHQPVDRFTLLLQTHGACVVCVTAVTSYLSVT